MSLLGPVIGGTAEAVFGALGRFVADGAVWLLAQVGAAMSATTTVDLGAAWFSEHLRAMATLSAAVVLPMVCSAAIVAVYRQDASTLVRTFLVQLPLALVLTGAAVELVRLGLVVTDQLSAWLLAGAGADAREVLAPVSAALLAAGTVTAGAVPAFAVVVGGVIVACASFALWLELVVRAAALSAATLFMPLAMAGLVWPSVSHWCRRLADTIAALVLSKLVVAAVISMASAALASGAREAAGGRAAGFAAVVTGAALLLVASSAPFVLLRLVPAVEAGAVAHLESARHRMRAGATTPVRAARFALSVASQAAAGAAGAEAAGGIGESGEVGEGVPWVRGSADRGTWPQSLRHHDFGPAEPEDDDTVPGDGDRGA